MKSKDKIKRGTVNEEGKGCCIFFFLKDGKQRVHWVNVNKSWMKQQAINPLNIQRRAILDVERECAKFLPQKHAWQVQEH